MKEGILIFIAWAQCLLSRIISLKPNWKIEKCPICRNQKNKKVKQQKQSHSGGLGSFVWIIFNWIIVEWRKSTVRQRTHGRFSRHLFELYGQLTLNDEFFSFDCTFIDTVEKLVANVKRQLLQMNLEHRRQFLIIRLRCCLM